MRKRLWMLAFGSIAWTWISASSTSTTPAPKVTGPIPASAKPGDPSRNYPFFSTVQWLDAYDYQEEEFYIEGLANAYVIDGRNTGTVEPGSPYPFKTRVIVRRPKSARAFNGTVILEWINVAPMNDFEIDWTWSHEHLMRRGFVHIGASVQARDAESPIWLKKWNPTRYGSLDVTAGGKFRATPQLAFGIFSQVVQAIKNPSGTSLVGNLKVKNVVATGHSASGQFLSRYYNSVHPLVGVVDGFVFHGASTPAISGLIRTDLRTPAWKLLSEADVLVGQAVVRQPDTANFRTWEVAGTSHGDYDLTLARLPLWNRDLPGIDKPPNCTPTLFSHVPSHLVQAAVYDHMKRWVETGKQPPSAPPITMSSIGKMGTLDEARSVVARDENGNALGGIRLAQFAVPTATDTGWNEGCNSNRGSHEPFDAAKLLRLYPSRAKYLAEVNRITDENLKAGYITKEGAEQTKKDVARLKIAGW